MNTTNIQHIRTAFNAAMFRGPDLAEGFFARLFEAQPVIRSLFAPDASQRDRDVLAALSVLVKNLHRLDAIAPLLEDAGARCQRAGVQPHHFGVAREALLGALKDVLGPKWTDDLEADCREALDAAASIMIRAGGRARLRAA